MWAGRVEWTGGKIKQEGKRGGPRGKKKKKEKRGGRIWAGGVIEPSWANRTNEPSERGKKKRGR
jgi:hypothetical protein